MLWGDDQGRGFAVNETGEQCPPLHIFVRISQDRTSNQGGRPEVAPTRNVKLMRLCDQKRVCVELDGRTMFAPTGVVLTPTEKALGVRAFGDYFSVLNGASGMPVSLKIVTSQ